MHHSTNISHFIHNAYTYFALIYFEKLTASCITCIIALHKIQVAFLGRTPVKTRGALQKASCVTKKEWCFSWMTYVSPSPTEFLPMQISGHFSVQSSSTFRSR